MRAIVLAVAFAAVVPAPSSGQSDGLFRRVSLRMPRISGPFWLEKSLPARGALTAVCPAVVLRDPIIHATLRSDGVSEDLAIASSTGCDAADRLVLDSVKTWTFEPALADGMSVTVHKAICVSLDSP